jgi:N-acetylmuramoyl-L-alanine amidase
MRLSIRGPAQSLCAGIVLAISLATGAEAQAAAGCPVKKLSVAVDIGHSEKRGGALSARGVREYSFNARFARELIAAAKIKPTIKLFLISPTNSNVGLKERPRIAAARGADVFLSIHHDSAQLKYFRDWEFNGVKRKHAASIQGYSLFVSKDGRESARSAALARQIGKKFLAAGATPTLHHAEPIKGENRQLIYRKAGVYEAPFAVLRLAQMPAVLIEVGVIANKDDEEKLNSPSYRSTLQRAILNALSDFCPEQRK